MVKINRKEYKEIILEPSIEDKTGSLLKNNK